MQKPHLKLKEKLILLEMPAFAKNVFAACEYMGVSRKTYYQIKKRTMKAVLHEDKLGFA